MNKKIILIVIGLILIGAAGLFFLSRKPSVNPNLAGTILFYGQGCPHCKIVEDYLSQNNIKDKVSFQELEVFFNNKNADLLGQLAKRCGLDNETIGVPLLWDGVNSLCYTGDVDVVNFFKTKAGL